jgi:Big-like domain-containing protein
LITVNAPPTASLTNPAVGATFTAPATVTVSATASDSDRTISKVEFFAGATLVGTVTTAPYSVTWSNVAAGGYTLTAKATDNSGAATTSSGVNITVGAPPTVILTSPAAGATFTAPATITVSATATDSDGTISKVEFYAGTTLIGTDTTAPYNVSWSNVAAGGYTLTAKATDNRNAATTSMG